MNINITPHPAGSKSDELVPSRYAVRVGEIDVLVVSDGVLPLPSTMMARNADPAVRAAKRPWSRSLRSTTEWRRSSKDLLRPNTPAQSSPKPVKMLPAGPFLKSM
jgi:hypothetical protein